MKADELENIVEELLASYQNLKAEVVIAELQKNSGLTEDDLVVKNKSTFRRSHRRDIISITDTDGKLDLELSRNGLYDYLPEGVFHSKGTTKGPVAYPDIRKNYKKEEEEARHFFLPIENEFFSQKLHIENKEQDLLNNFLNLDDNFLINFWKINASIPKKYLLKLLRLLPYSYKIAGNLELTSLCLEEIIKKKVKITKTYCPRIINNEDLFETNNQLGVNFTLHNSFDTLLQPTYEVEIGPISEDKVLYYNKEDGFLKFLNVFCDYFFPVEVEIKTSFKVNLKDGFLLSKEKEPVIGFTTLI